MAINFGTDNFNAAVPQSSFKNISNHTLKVSVAGVIYSIAPGKIVTFNTDDAQASSDLTTFIAAGKIQQQTTFGIKTPVLVPTPPQVIIQQVPTPPSDNVGGFSGLTVDDNGYWVLADGNRLIYPNNNTRRQPPTGLNSIITCRAEIRRQDSKTGNLGFAIYTDTTTGSETFANGYLVHWLADGTGAVYKVINGSRHLLAITQESPYPQDEHHHKFSVTVLQPHTGQLEFFLYTDGVLIAQAIDLNNGFVSGAVGFSTSEGSTPIYVTPNSFQFDMGAEEYSTMPIAVQNAVTELSTLVLGASSTQNTNATGLNTKNLIPDSGFIWGHTYWNFDFAGTMAIENAVGADGGNGVVYTQGALPGSAGSIFIYTDNVDLIPLRGGVTYCLSINVDARQVSASGPNISLYTTDLVTQLCSISQSLGVNGIISCTYTPPGTGIEDVAVIISMNGCTVNANGNVIMSVPQLEVGSVRTNYVQTLVLDTEQTLRHKIHSTAVQATVSGTAGGDGSYLAPGLLTSRHFKNALTNDLTLLWDASAGAFLHNKMSSATKTLIVETPDSDGSNLVHSSILSTHVVPGTGTHQLNIDVFPDTITHGKVLQSELHSGTVKQINDGTNVRNALAVATNMDSSGNSQLVEFPGVVLNPGGYLTGFSTSGTSSNQTYTFPVSGKVSFQAQFQLTSTSNDLKVIIGDTNNGYALRWNHVANSVIIEKIVGGTESQLNIIALSTSQDTNIHSVIVTAVANVAGNRVEASFDNIQNIVVDSSLTLTSGTWPVTIVTPSTTKWWYTSVEGAAGHYTNLPPQVGNVITYQANANGSFLSPGVVFDGNIGSVKVDTLTDGTYAKTLASALTSGVPSKVTDGTITLTGANLTNAISTAGLVKVANATGLLPYANHAAAVTNALDSVGNIKSSPIFGSGLATGLSSGTMSGFATQSSGGTPTNTQYPFETYGAWTISVDIMRNDTSTNKPVEVIIGDVTNGYGLRWDFNGDVNIIQYSDGTVTKPAGFQTVSGTGVLPVDTAWHNFRIAVSSDASGRYTLGTILVEASLDIALFLQVPVVDPSPPGNFFNIPAPARTFRICTATSSDQVANPMIKPRDLYLAASTPYQIALDSNGNLAAASLFNNYPAFNTVGQIDFSTGGSGIINKTLDNLPDGSTYERVLGTDIASGHVVKLFNTEFNNSSIFRNSNFNLAGWPANTLVATNIDYPIANPIKILASGWMQLGGTGTTVLWIIGDTTNGWGIRWITGTGALALVRWKAGTPTTTTGFTTVTMDTKWHWWSVAVTPGATPGSSDITECWFDGQHLGPTTQGATLVTWGSTANVSLNTGDAGALVQGFRISGAGG